MSIILSDLYQSTRTVYQLRLIAGEQGMTTPIYWVQFTEDIETTGFLKGGELIITTGMSANSENWLYDFIKQLIQQQTSGLIINTGRYILPGAISREVIQLCDTHHFPLFTMPWKIHLATIMQDYCNRIFMQSYQDDRTTMAFQRLLLHPEDLETSVDTLNSLGYETMAPYLVMVCSNLISPEPLTGRLRTTGTKCYLFQREDHHLIILQNPSRTALSDMFSEFSELSLSGYGMAVCFGIGDISESLVQLSTSYQHALFALQTATKEQLRYQFFSDLGLFKLFFSVKNTTLLEAFYKEHLSRLEEYDATSNTNLTETLRLYIEHDGSIQAAADAAFTHRNTINYRMKKIRQILNQELVSMDEKFNLRLAFMIRDYLNF